jgi:hypothetical protein
LQIEASPASICASAHGERRISLRVLRYPDRQGTPPMLNPIDRKDIRFSRWSDGRVHGKDAIMKKGDWWREDHKVHGVSVSGPYVNGDQFVVRFTIDLTPKTTGQRMTMDEMGIYAVENGKIVSERFFCLQA